MLKRSHDLSSSEQALLERLQSGQNLQDALSPLIKRVMEAALAGEMDAHLADQPLGTNRRNGKTSKQVKSSSGSFALEVPRDRSGEL